jgi:hypothetical protein
MKFIKSFFDAVIHARRLQAAYHTANHLIATNKDFRHFSHGELVNRIMDEDNPTHLDGTPVHKEA